MPTSENKSIDIAHLRKDYTVAGLLESHVDPNPVKQFEKWIKEAMTAGLPEPTAMTLATATKSGKPSARIVLLKDFDNFGFVFFTNYESRKGRELFENPKASLLFHWVDLEREVRIEGAVEKVSREDSERYFRTRPKGSQLGAWASRQSEVITGREVLEDRVLQLEAEYRDKEIPMPHSWGGYRVKPDRIEFWQGRPSRLHDRIRYSRESNGTWRIERLSP